MRRVTVDDPPEVEEPARRKDRKPPVKSAESPIPYPAAAVHWRLRRDGVKLSAFTSGGGEAFSWPIAEFTTKNVLERWGGGVFTVYFFDSKGSPRGNVQFRLAGAPRMTMPEPSAEPEVRAEVLPAERPDELARAVSLYEVLERVGSQKANLQIQTFKEMQQGSLQAVERMVGAVMGREARREEQAASLMPERLAAALERIDARLTALEEGGGDEDDEVDADDDDAPSDGFDAPEPPEDWNLLGKIAYQVLMRQMPALEQALPELVKGWVERLQAEARTRAAAQAAQAAANGAGAP